MRISVLGTILLATSIFAQPIEEERVEVVGRLKNEYERAQEEITLYEISTLLEKIARWHYKLEELQRSGTPSDLPPQYPTAVSTFEDRLLELERLILLEAQKTHLAPGESLMEDFDQILDKPVGERGSDEDSAYGEFFGYESTDLPTTMVELERYRILHDIQVVDAHQPSEEEDADDEEEEWSKQPGRPRLDSKTPPSPDSELLNAQIHPEFGDFNVQADFGEGKVGIDADLRQHHRLNHEEEENGLQLKVD